MPGELDTAPILEAAFGANSVFRRVEDVKARDMAMVEAFSMADIALPASRTGASPSRRATIIEDALAARVDLVVPGVAFDATTAASATARASTTDWPARADAAADAARSRAGDRRCVPGRACFRPPARAARGARPVLTPCSRLVRVPATLPSTRHRRAKQNKTRNAPYTLSTVRSPTAAARPMRANEARINVIYHAGVENANGDLRDQVIRRPRPPQLHRGPPGSTFCPVPPHPRGFITREPRPRTSRPRRRHHTPDEHPLAQDVLRVLERILRDTGRAS